MYRTIILFAMAFISISCHAQLLCRKRDFGHDKALMRSHISNAQQDKQRFIWLATWNGLVRYDGYRYTTFKPILLSNGKIKSNRIYNIKMSSSGDIWCLSSDNRLLSFSRKSCRFTDIQSILSCISTKQVKTLTPLSNGCTWVTFKDFSCLRLNDQNPLSGYQFYKAHSRDLAYANKIYSIEFCNGNEWILTDRAAIDKKIRKIYKGNFRFANSVRDFTVLTTENGRMIMIGKRNRIIKAALPNAGDVVVTYTKSQGNNLFLATNRGLWKMDVSSCQFERISDKPFTFLYLDRHDRIWAFLKDNSIVMVDGHHKSRPLNLTTIKASEPGKMKNPQIIMENDDGTVILKPNEGVLSYFDEPSNRLLPCLFGDNNDEVYAPKDIKKFLVDSENALWVFHEGGVDCMSFQKQRFIHRSYASGQEIRAIAIDHRGRYLFGNRSGSLIVCDNNMSAIGSISADGSIVKRPTKLAGMPIYCILENGDHSLWVGTKGDGLYILSPMDKDGNRYKVSHYFNERNNAFSLRSDTIYDILRSGSQMFLASYGSGISVASNEGGKWRFSNIPNQPAGMKVRTISEIAHGVFLLGTADGLVTMDLRSPSHPRFYTNSYRPESWGLKGNDIMGLCNVGGVYYALVFGSGVSKISGRDLFSNNLHFMNYPFQSSLLEDQIKTAVSVKDCIWVVSDQTITCFNTATSECKTYNSDDFMGRYIFSEARPVVDHGLITVGTLDGTLSFSADLDNNDVLPSRLAVTGIQYQNNVSVSPLNDIDSLVVSPEHRNFTLFLSSMEYGRATTRRVRYIMDGFDNGWNYSPEGQPSATYSRLLPGTYKLRIQMADAFGRRADDSKIITVVVSPKFTETLAFRIFIVFLLNAVVIGLAFAANYFRHMRNIIRKKYSLLLTVDEFNTKLPIRSETQPENDSERKDNDFLKEQMAYLNEHISESNLSIDDMARHAGMSRTAYYNKMKAVAGVSPIDFIKQLRIKRALRLLDEGSLSITEVAYSSGFSDSRYFSRCFKAEMGMTPTKYIETKKSKS
ncbi:helix-turn-helix domain-containing protein [Prevotella sp.]|uniref:helix-turn-helix domain-containing protein n=1 Tax=Prevotella sp. TaxID=59823 RepID=UPI003FD827D3